MNDKVDFGFEKVNPDEKTRRVGGVFDSVASRYDVMNDVMSLGIHRLWKRFFVEQSGVRAGQSVLDLAGGTGDIARLMMPRVGDSGRVVIADINNSMLIEGRKRLLDSGVAGNVSYLQVNAEHLPFRDGEFHCITIAFGLRNVTDKQRALEEMYRVLGIGGRVMILEFSHPAVPVLKSVYDAYSFRVLPAMGRLVAGDAESYRYLAESIRMHPDQESLLAMLEQAGFERCSYHNLTGGIVAVHSGYRL
ncbi:MAG: bifunctional demethylmenaquinone methyltransferase/2-methoxy-6-polyprenyl-1,4-benzoquinol methylase UbiE [Gammaproteobacteria bacterium]|nr:bifunctional demethylmenaquinone methyltransferase/2-methoxy-6-polyprenyl-1,4-benzoquinol methylase UbiE [Gammaproteobacteria bacterium]NNF60181.1 bifunctional demethylmenaquinone methyltransferase/2-methoxy-6-polyprenyl-1,4-benzoquinol methylase UbiE [Gammaproteobacteria bacterium]NNM21594.1 bifunctional demethylmenaquinone methyltransferase/2-methoxy-6-polyprenyl-1,4-benzoquinol methylase UbiE [Gammaproteobacteria bacterium]